MDLRFAGHPIGMTRRYHDPVIVPPEGRRADQARCAAHAEQLQRARASGVLAGHLPSTAALGAAVQGMATMVTDRLISTSSSWRSAGLTGLFLCRATAPASLRCSALRWVENRRFARAAKSSNVSLLAPPS